MTVADYLLELVHPFTDSAVLVGMIAFTALLALAMASGLTGLWLLIVVLPAASRFLIGVSEARIAEKRVQPMGLELFGWFNNIWALLPLVLIGLAGLAQLAVYESFGLLAAIVLAALFNLVIPASLGVLALTRSPETALNPLALWELIVRCGWSYASIPATATVLAALLAWLEAEAIPGWAMNLSSAYALTVLFSLTGFVVQRGGLRELVGAAEGGPLVRRVRERDPDLEREQVLNHAYGLFSRGNSQGGLAHIEDFIERSAQNGDLKREYEWFFQRALQWEGNVPGLMIGQRYLAELLDADDEHLAIKVLSRCLHEDERFKPLPADSERLRQIAESLGRDDLTKRL